MFLDKINYMKIDGGSLFYVYAFLKKINDTINTKILKFRISKEDLVLNKTFYETYDNYETFYTKHIQILSYRPFCETGAYYRITNVSIQITDNKKNIYDLNIYFDGDNIKYTSKASTSLDVFFPILKEAQAFIPKINYVISVRKARYVDPCYVDDDYIDENFPNQ
jgi:hypothetical protein